jgi:ABC-type transport system involved in cytochrome c biogenesis permease subunit
MTLKTDTLGWLLNAQVLLSALSIFLPKALRKWTWRAVLPVAIAIIALRWISVDHPPMRNLFEAFLWLPPLLTGMTYYSAWRNQVDTTRLDAILGFIVAFPLAFVFSAAMGRLPPVLQSPLFVPHVLGYMVAYVLLTRAFILECLKQVAASRENAAWGFAFISLSLALGSYWGNEAWGAYWQWDPKEQWSLATWLVYAAYFHLRGNRKWRLALLGLGVLFILLTVTWINLSKLFSGMHSYAGV